MHKAERLFHLLNLLRNRRTVLTAKYLAEQIGVSERTIYRDIQALCLSGVPIEGEAGVGYLLRKFDLPPLMFDNDEVEALLLGARMAMAWSDAQMASNANSAMQKIMAVLPNELRELDDELPILAPRFAENPLLSQYSQSIREAIKQQNCIDIIYRRADGEISDRILEPLGLFFWGSAWTLVAWCRLRNDYRMFRLDRIEQLTMSDIKFKLAANKSLDHYLSLHCESKQH